MKHALTGRLAVYAAATLLALTSNFLLGRDVLWDTLHYHLYAGFSAVHDRFAQDYLAAGTAGYLNPYAYVPFYAMVAAGLPALTITSILAVAHSTLLWLTYELALSISPTDDRRTRLVIGACAVGLAFLDPILILQIGSSFADITTATLVLGAWLLLSRAVTEPRVARIVCAGLILGAATALKPTNAVHAVAGTVLLAWLPTSGLGRLRHALAYVAAGLAGSVVIAVPWARQVYRLFHNPFFPLFNGLFPSPGFPAQSWVAVRFIPASLGEALWRPFAMANPVAMIDSEQRMPDIRYAVLLILGAAMAGVLTARWSVQRARPPAGTAPPAPPCMRTRVMAALACGLVLDWVLWLATSANGRYLLPMGSVAAVLISGLLVCSFREWPRLSLYSLIAIFAVQTLQVTVGAEYRWDPRPWGGAWLDVRVPDALATEANLYLVYGMQSNSFIAPYLARDSALVNFAGAYPLAPNGPGGARIAELLRRYQPHVRVLFSSSRSRPQEQRPSPDVNYALARFGLRADEDDCSTIVVVGVPPDLVIRLGSAQRPSSEPIRRLVACRVLPDHADHSADLAEQRVADRVFDRIEDACPLLFQPRRVLSEHSGAAWQRIYLNTDLELRISNGSVRLFDPARGDDPLFLGSTGQWLTEPSPRLACARSSGHYTARLIAPPALP